MYVVCKSGEFVWNEGGVVQLTAPYITLCDFLTHKAQNYVTQKFEDSKNLIYQSLKTLCVSYLDM